MGEGDSTSGFGMSIGDVTGPFSSGFTPQTLGTDAVGSDTVSAPSWGSSSGNSLSDLISNYDAEYALGPDGTFGRQALSTNPFTDENAANYTTPDVDYNSLDWLKGNFKKYSNIINPILGIAGRFHPGVAAAHGLMGLFTDPAGSLGGRAGGAMGGAIGGSVAGPWGGALGSMYGATKGGQLAREAEGTYGMGTASTKSSSSPDYGLLAGAWLGQKAAKDFGQQKSDLQSLYGQNSPYAQQLRQRLQREDAAAGRRSQVGQREVELQARLADLNSRNAPQVQSLTKDQRMAQLSTLRDLAWLGKQAGWFGG